MLHYLPIPRPDELLYSILARYAVHSGIVSPKQCLDNLFNSRTVVATVDLPSHLDVFLNNAARLWDIPVSQLIYKHTLFPIYAPFIPNERRLAAISHMRGSSGGAQHMALGIATSVIKTPDYMRYCPACLTQQQNLYGEYYWPRAWQVSGVEICSLHGSLVDSSIHFRPIERHRYVPATPYSCLTGLQPCQEAIPHTMEKAVCKLANQLLLLPPRSSPSYHQWSQFYHDLAASLGCTRGAHILHRDLHHLLLCRWNGWGKDIATMGLRWLPSLFRKHRKSFSHVQHLAVWAALLPEVSAEEILRRVLSLPKHPAPSKAEGASPTLEPPITSTYRFQWLQALQSFNHRGIKWIRRNQPGMAASYAWLYRNEREWLLAINERYKLKPGNKFSKVDWIKRDETLCRELRRIAEKSDSAPRRRSKTWLINQLPINASISKNLDKLPLLSCLLREISESVADYQVRRCNHAIVELKAEGIPISRWRIVRRAGLNPISIRPSTKHFLASLNGAACEQNDDPEHPE